MVNWYYVSGSERVGPVEEVALRDLFAKKEIDLETYVWRKGFTNWERLKEVWELDFSEASASLVIPEKVMKIPEPKPEAKAAPETVAEVSSPEVSFNFSWSSVRENEELFFLKIGKDRALQNKEEIYGPYSMVELKEALKEKRINMHTLVFAPGMPAWTKVEDTPLNGAFRGVSNSLGLLEIPLMMVFHSSPLPLVTVVKRAGVNEGVLLGAGPFSEFEGKTVKVSLYMGNEIKAKNVNVRVKAYEKKGQTIDCYFIQLSADAQKIMLNHAV